MPGCHADCPRSGWWRLLVTAAGVALALPCQAKGRLFDDPEIRLSRTIDVHRPPEKSDGTGAQERPVPIERNCQVYRSHAVIWIDDPWIMGAAEIQIRVRPKGMKAAQVCGTEFRGRAFSIAPDEAYPWGVRGRFLFLQSADGFGALRDFRIYDMDSGKKVLEDTFHEETGITLSRGPRGLELTYWTALPKITCVPRAEDPTCWARIRVENRVPPGAEMAPPDCQAAVASEPSVLETHAVQITVAIQVQGFARARATFLSQPPTCDPAP
jgi:hypothetical protein